MKKLIDSNIDPCLEKREHDEPMFILLARDSAAPNTILIWCKLREDEIRNGTRLDTQEEHEHITEVRQKANLFREWRKANRK